MISLLVLRRLIPDHCYLFYTPGIYADGYSIHHSGRPFVCSYVRTSASHFPSRSSFLLKLKWLYLSKHSSESIHIWIIGTLEGQLSCHQFGTKVMPRDGT